MTKATDPRETCAALNRLLRAELTAVNQQSVHLLALRCWGSRELEARIRDVDRADFPATLAIIDHMVAVGLPITIESEGFAAGATERAILLAEQRAEASLASAAARVAGLDGPAGRLAAAVSAPRADYADWIMARLGRAPTQEPVDLPLVAELADLFASLTVMGEQALIHAFVHWHRGDRIDADAAWGASGAAMLRAGDIIHLLAAEGAVPMLGKMPALNIHVDPARAIAADRNLGGRCQEVARAAALGCGTEPARNLAHGIAIAAGAWADRRAGTTLPPQAGATATFASFQRTRLKFLRQAAAADSKAG